MCVFFGCQYPIRLTFHFKFFLGPTLFSTREIAGDSVRIFTWATGAPAAITRIWGPEHLGGLGDFPARVEEEARRTGAIGADIGDKVSPAASLVIVRQMN